MEVLELKPINKKRITIYLIEKYRISSELNDIDKIKELVNNNNISFITVEINNENFRTFKDSNLSTVLKALNLEYYLFDMPEYAYGYLFEEINKKEEQISELLMEYRKMKDKESFKGLNLKSWIDVLKREVNQDKQILETKIRPQWIVKKILDLVRSNENGELALLHFCSEKTLSEITEQLRELHIEVFVYELNSLHNIPNLIIKQEENN
ncbi:MAG: hypothetical protein ACFFAB_12910 [Candidatus Heimdallarchaeota archaeon]